MRSSVQEGWRLTATWLNTMGAGFVVTGFAVPAVAWGYHAPGYQFDIHGLDISAALTLGGFVIHVTARLLLWIVNR